MFFQFILLVSSILTVCCKYLEKTFSILFYTKKLNTTFFLDVIYDIYLIIKKKWKRQKFNCFLYAKRKPE